MTEEEERKEERMLLHALNYMEWVIFDFDVEFDGAVAGEVTVNGMSDRDEFRFASTGFKALETLNFKEKERYFSFLRGLLYHDTMMMPMAIVQSILGMSGRDELELEVEEVGEDDI